MAGVDLDEFEASLGGEMALLLEVCLNGQAKDLVIDLKNALQPCA